MEKRKMLTALLLCCFAITPVSARFQNQDIIDQTVTGQTNAGVNGGAAEFTTGTGTITNSSFSQNSTDHQGGAIYNTATLTITDGTETQHSSFSGNIAHSGGAIRSEAGSTLTIGDYTSFDNNRTSNNNDGEAVGDAGGALYITGANLLDVGNNVSFTNNEALSTQDPATAAKGAAGAVFIYESDATFGDNLTVSGNESKYAGGGLYIWNIQDDKTASIGKDATFENNKSTGAYGGAIGNFDGDLTIGEGARFTGNEAKTNGGAIANMTFSTSDVALAINGGTDNTGIDGTDGKDHRAHFSGNIAEGNGGAIYNAANAATTVKNTVFSNNKAYSGGAIYNAANATVAMENVTVNSASGDNLNDIYNEGGITTSGENTFASKFVNDGSVELNGKNTFSGVLEGSETSSITNNGELILADASNYAGTLTNTSADSVTTVTDKYLAGDEVFSTGTLNWQTTNEDALDGTLDVTGDAKLNIGGTADGTNGTLYLENGSSIANTVTTTINAGSKLDIQGGTATLDDDTNDTWNGDVAISSGSLTVDGLNHNGKLNATGGTLNLMNNAAITLGTGSKIAEAVKASIGAGTVVNINDGAKVTLNGTAGGTNNDTWDGDITLSTGGTLTVDGVDNNGKLNATGGTLSLDNTTITLGTGSQIAEAVKATIGANADVNIGNGAEVTLNNGDTWTGDVALSTGGTLTVEDIASNGKLTTNGGTLNIGNATTGTNGKLALASGSSIDGGATTNIKAGSELNIKGGEATLNGGDAWNGKIILGTEGVQNDESSLTVGLPAGSTMGQLEANNGKLNILNSLNLDIGENSYIKEAVAIETSGNINILNGGEVAIDDNDNLNGGAKVTLTDGGTLNYGKTTTTGSSAIIEADGGNLNLLANSQLTLTSGSQIDDAVALNIHKGATLNLDQSLNLNLSSEDTWNGKIVNQNGVINANNVTKFSESAALEQSNGELNLYNDSTITLGNNSTISGGDINITKGDDGSNGSVLTVVDANITGGNMTIDKYSKFAVGSGTFQLDRLTANDSDAVNTAIIDTMNGQRNMSEIKTLNINNQADFNIDIHARSNKNTSNDQFKILDGKVTGGGTANVEQWALNGDIYGWDAPIDRHIKLGDVFLDENGKALQTGITVTEETTFTPIGWYQLNKNEEYEDIKDPVTGLITGQRHIGSNYTLDMVKYNPQVFRGQVVTVAQWMNQLNIDDMLFTHSMILPSFKEEDGGANSSMMANRYAATSPLFAPYQYSRKDGGLWYKAYGTFENLQMNNGLSRVGNNAYGALVGADLGLRELKNGWKFMPTAYLGYNGAHQTFAKVGAYQNGGQLGFLGTWYKDNVILGALAYSGMYNNSMDVFGHTDDTVNYFAGTAGKAAYNIRLHRDWVFQPNLFVSYNYFGQQNWHTNFGQMGMMAGDLHGVNIAPGMNLIWEKETFSAYATLQYMYNVNGAVGGRAGNVNLPQMEMERGYIQYGLGFVKKFTDRTSGYFQTVFRNVGRTGVGFQLGFNIFLGK